MSAEVIRLRGPIAGFHIIVPPDKEAEPTPEEIITQKLSEIGDLEDKIKALSDEILLEREKSYNLGFQDGLIAEQKKHEEQLDAHAVRLRDLAGKLEEQFTMAMHQLEEPLLRMSFNISEKIIGIALTDEVKTGALVMKIKEYLDEVIHESSIVVRLNPMDLPLFKEGEMAADVKSAFPGRLKYVADHDLQRGEVMLETPEHVIDGRFQTQLEVLAGKIG